MTNVTHSKNKSGYENFIKNWLKVLIKDYHLWELLVDTKVLIFWIADIFSCNIFFYNIARFESRPLLDYNIRHLGSARCKQKTDIISFLPSESRSPWGGCHRVIRLPLGFDSPNLPTMIGLRDPAPRMWERVEMKAKKKIEWRVRMNVKK